MWTKGVHVRSEASTAAKINEVSSDYPPCHLVKIAEKILLGMNMFLMLHRRFNLRNMLQNLDI
jgi:hypothetical protein